MPCLAATLQGSTHLQSEALNCVVMCHPASTFLCSPLQSQSEKEGIAIAVQLMYLVNSTIKACNNRP